MVKENDIVRLRETAPGRNSRQEYTVKRVCDDSVELVMNSSLFTPISNVILVRDEREKANANRGTGRTVAALMLLEKSGGGIFVVHNAAMRLYASHMVKKHFPVPTIKIEIMMVGTESSMHRLRSLGCHIVFDHAWYEHANYFMLRAHDTLRNVLKLEEKK